MRILSRALLALLLLLSACAAANAGSGASLEGRTFLSTDVIDGGSIHQVVAQTRIRISFRDGQISLSAGCNSMGGSYKVLNGVLSVADLATTDMACDQPRMAQDEWLAGFITAGPTVRLDGNTLRLKFGATVIKLVDREVAEPDQPLVGPTWTVVSVISGDAVSSVPDGVVATLQFTADGKVLINTGCNGAGGTYSVGSGTLVLSDIVTELKLCPGPRNDMETAVLGVVRAGKVRYAIDARLLTLTSGDKGLQLQAS
jgi:heat shock protein HslJ